MIDSCAGRYKVMGTLDNLLRKLDLKCSFGCSHAVGIYWMTKGCAARPKQRLQCLCAQHLISAEPIGNMNCLFEIWPVRGY